MNRTIPVLILVAMLAGATMLAPLASAGPVDTEELQRIVQKYQEDMVDALESGKVCVTFDGRQVSGLRTVDVHGDAVTVYVPIFVEAADPANPRFTYEAVTIELSSVNCEAAVQQSVDASYRFSFAVVEWSRERLDFNGGGPPLPPGQPLGGDSHQLPTIPCVSGC